MSSAQPDDDLVKALVKWAAEISGYSTEAIFPEAIRRLVRARLAAGQTLEALQRQRAEGAPELLAAVRQVVAVGETYFFRHPEHFRFISEQILPRLRGPGPVSALSAGCATGEEAYSLAACLLDGLPAGSSLRVLGVEVSETPLEIARQGIYGAWSVRDSGPMLHPIFAPRSTGDFAIAERVRAVSRFRAHDLRAPLPELSGFDVILCRNVFLYLNASTTAQVIENLVAALSPRGVILFGAVDVDRTPPGLVRLGPAAIQAFERPQQTISPAPAPKQRIASAPAPAAAPKAPAQAPIETTIAVHVRALELIERGERQQARSLLLELSGDYVPALLERALLHGQKGERAAAVELMRDVLRRLRALPEDELVPGPEPLPVGFYRATAHAFLGKERP